MIDDDNEWSALREFAKRNHDERVVKTPQRIEFAEKLFNERNIKYVIKNKAIGHFHLFSIDGDLVQFWCSTGKIMFDKKVREKYNLKLSMTDWRGVHNAAKIIGIINNELQPKDEKPIDINKPANENKKLSTALKMACNELAELNERFSLTELSKDLYANEKYKWFIEQSNSQSKGGCVES